MNIGDTLRTARESAGLSVEDIVNSTHMTARKVECLEKNAFDDSFEFAAPVYVKGFIRSYARAVGIDPEPLVRDYITMVKEGGPRSKKPVVPMEATEPKDGSFQRVMAKIPARERDHFAIPVEQGVALEKRVARDAAPIPARPAPAAMPVPVVAKPAPVPIAAKPVSAAESAPAADDLFSALVPEPVSVPEPAAAAKPQVPAEEPKADAVPAPSEPAKRVAPIEHGVQPIEPPEKAVRNGVRPIIIPDPVPAKKPTEEDEDGETAVRNPKAAPVAPKPVPLTVAPFVFPGSDSLIGKIDSEKEWSLSGGIAPTPLVPPSEPKVEPKPEPVVPAPKEEPVHEDAQPEKKNKEPDCRNILADPASAPNPISLFFANIHHSISEHFERKRIEKMAKDSEPKSGLRLTKTGKIVFGSLAGLAVLALAICLIPGKGASEPGAEPGLDSEPEPYVEVADDEEAAESAETALGPVSIVSVLPAPISFAK